MTKKVAFLYVGACLSMFVPAPPRFAYGIVLVLIANMVLLITIPIKVAIDYFKIYRYRTVLLLLVAVTLTIFCYQILTLFSPIMALSVGFVVYLIPLSSYTMGFIFLEKTNSISEAYKKSLKSNGILSVFGLVFFLLREFLAFGSISFPGMNGIIVFNLPFDFLVTFGFFWKSIPGALILLAGFLVILSLVYRRTEITRRFEK